MDAKIPFNKPFIIGKELYYIAQAVQSGHLSGDGMFTKRCHTWMEQKFDAKKVLLTNSCTAALEMAAILADIQQGDEVIMPSFTFVTTANAFVLRGAVPVWCDIREDTLNIDETKIEALITSKTKAIVPVHYAGVGCEMDTIMEIAEHHNLLVVEDTAQAMNTTYKGRYLGTIGHLGAYSFHETKNFISGEGGALVINDDRFIERAEVIREKGTNRSKFFRGEVDKYTWTDIGSSYLPSEIIAAFLYAQLEESDAITKKRRTIFSNYATGLAPLATQNHIRLPFTPNGCIHNGHMFYIITNTAQERADLIAYLKAQGVHAVFHYLPLHTSPMGQKIAVSEVELPVTEDISGRLVRLPCYFELSEEEQDRVVGGIRAFFEEIGKIKPLIAGGNQ